MIGNRIRQCPGQQPIAQVDIDKGVGGTQNIAKFMLCRAKVTLHMQLLPGPGLFIVISEAFQVGIGLICSKGLGNGLSGNHAGLHGCVAALDLGEIECAGIVTDQQPAGK